MDALERLRGKFIVLDGVDGAGKGEQIRLLREVLAARDIEAVIARDPGGTPIGDRIRHVLLDYDLSQMDIGCETLLFMASRAQLVRDVIKPAMSRNAACLGDRFVSATCAYQGAAGADVSRVIEVARFAIGDTWPHLTLIVDLPPSAGFERTKRKRNSGGNRAAVGGQQKLFHDVHTDAMESRPLAFHKRVRDLFLELPSYYPAPVAVVDGAGSVEAVHGRVMEALSHAAL